MWEKKHDPESAQPESTSEQREALRRLGDALSQSLVMNDEFQKRDFAVGSEEVLIKDSNQPLTSPVMNTYTNAVNEFTRNATGFIEHLPLLIKARAAYEEAMKASAEMRTALDTSDEHLRALMTRLEQQLNLHELKSAADKKPPEPARVETMKATNERGGRAFRWP